jgi:hypothetical protein
MVEYFARHSTQPPQEFTVAAAVPYRHYSIGAALTGSEAAAYNTALAAFRTALGRTA